MLSANLSSIFSVTHPSSFQAFFSSFFHPFKHFFRLFSLFKQLISMRKPAFTVQQPLSLTDNQFLPKKKSCLVWPSFCAFVSCTAHRLRKNNKYLVINIRELVNISDDGKKMVLRREHRNTRRSRNGSSS